MYPAFGSMSELTIDDGLELLDLRGLKSLDGYVLQTTDGEDGRIAVVFELRIVRHVIRGVPIDDLHV